MTPVLAFLPLGTSEVLLIVAIFVLLFGSAKIPQIAAALGRAQADYKKAKRSAERELDDEGSDAALLRRARELGIATDGRAIADIRRDVETKG